MQRRLPFLVLALLLAACGGQLAGGDSVGGTWTGAVNTTGVSLTLELTQTGVSLSATLTVNETSVVMTGTAAESPSATLVSLTAQGDNPVRIEASVEGNTMTGTLAVEGTKNISAGRFTATR